MIGEFVMEIEKKLLFLVLLILLSLSSYAQNRMKDNRDNYLKFLKEEGFSPKLDNDGDILFQMDSLSYYLLIYDESPPLYIQIQNEGVRLDESEFGNIRLVSKIMNTVNTNQRLAKIVIEDGILRIKIELLIENANAFRYLFYRSMQYLNDSFTAFKTEYNKQLTKTASAKKDSIEIVSPKKAEYQDI